MRKPGRMLGGCREDERTRAPVEWLADLMLDADFQTAVDYGEVWKVDGVRRNE